MKDQACPHHIDRWLTRFGLERFLHEHVAAVLHRLPATVRQDLMEDPAFLLCDYDPHARLGVQVPVRVPSGGGCSRSVVLKRTLRQRSTHFVRWLIAHELAHAHLRNGGRWEGDDPEVAADALAAAWGFPRPA